MSVKETAKRLYVRIIDNASERLQFHTQPNEGWLVTMRKALGMSGPQLAKRAGVTKAAIYQAERKELAGEITIKQMEKLASALGGRFVYAIVPDGKQQNTTSHQKQSMSVEALVRAQARVKAEAIIGRASTHMALEKQALSGDLNRSEIDRLTEQLVREMPSDFWEAN